MAGKLIGAFLLGLASDMFGRRKIFFLSVLLLVLSGLIAYIAPLYSIYLIARLLAGIANSGKRQISFDGTKRPTVMTGHCMSCTI